MKTNTPQKPTATQVEIMMNDWFKNLRQSGTFIHKNTKGAIRLPDSKDSKFIVGSVENSNIIEILKNARTIAQNTVNSMVKEPVSVKVGGSSSCTNGIIINVATNYFDDKRLSLQQKIDLLIGFSIHEACHINHSDMTALQAISESKNSQQIKELKMTISNILEDERIEYLLGDNEHPEGDAMPGFSDFIAKCKEYTFGKYSDGLKNAKMDDPVSKFINTLIAIVRFPSMLNEEVIIDQYENLKKVKNILTPFPLSSEGVFNATNKIVEVIKDIVKEDMQQQQSQSDQQQEQQEQQSQQNQSESQGGGSGQNESDQSSQTQNQQGQSENNEDSEQDKNDSSNNSQQPDQSPNGSDSNQNNTQESKQNKTQKAPTKKEVEKELENRLSSQEIKDLLSKVKELTQTPEGNSNNTSKELYSENKANEVNGDAESMTITTEGGYAVTEYFTKVKDNKPNYFASLARIKKYIPAMSRSLKSKTTEKDYELNGMKSGKLNTNKLVSLKLGNQNIFSQKGSVTCDSACICILIDESGSMYNRLTHTRDAAVLINEAVKLIPNLELFTYGFTNDTMTIYCERNNATRYALGSTRADGGTPTGLAMNVASKRIRKMTNSKCLMLILTDGAPDNSAEVKIQDNLLRKKNIFPVGIGIQNAPVNSIFQESVVINDISTLALEIGKLMKSKLLKSLKNHDTND